MKYIDTHCHLDFPDYGEEIGEVLNRMKDSEVGGITIGTDLESSKRAVSIAESNPNIWACIGVHPIQEDNTSPGLSSRPLLEAGEGKNSEPPLDVRGGKGELFNELEFEKLIQSSKVVGIGECGLDFFRVKPENLTKEKERQTILFKQQIEFALKYDKPLMLHCRDAYDEVLEILTEYKNQVGDKLQGNCHFFAGTPEQAKRFVDLNFSCSFTGVITFTEDYNDTIKSLPSEFILSETDSPFVAPVPHRGKRNEPSFVIEVVRKIAEIRGESLQNMSNILLNNAKRVFNL